MDALPGLTDATTGVQELMHASRELSARIARELGMPVSDVTAVGLLLQLGPMRVGVLAQRLGMRTASATVLVDRLVAAGRAVRRQDPGDRRGTVVEVTPTGRDESWALWEPAIRAVDGVAAGLPTAERAAVARYLARVTAVLHAHP